MDPKLNIYEFDVNRRVMASVSNDAYSYHFLFSYLGKVNGSPKFAMFWPNFSPETFNDRPIYKVIIGHFHNVSADDLSLPGLVTDGEFYIDISDTLAYAPFRFGGETYNSFVPLGWEYDPENTNGDSVETKEDVSYYISINPVKQIDGGYTIDINYSGSQTTYVSSTDFLASLDPVAIIEDELCADIKVYDRKNIIQISDLVEQVREMYKLGPNTEMFVEVSCFISDYSNVYGLYTQRIDPGDFSKDYIKIPFPKFIDNSTESNDFWSIRLNYSNPGWYETILTMQQYAILKIGYVVDEESYVKLLGFRTSNIPVNQDTIAAWLSKLDMIGSPVINLETSDMNNYPRIVNKNIVKVVEVTAKNNTKSNIVQPVFFKSYPTGSIVIHPAVTENIVINLDFYKAVVNRFSIQIDGVVFEEVARIAAGIVFNIKGNLLPNTLSAGTYYILDQDGELVTDGLYQYEY